MLHFKNLTLCPTSSFLSGGGKIFEHFLPIVSQNREETDFYFTDDGHGLAFHERSAMLLR